MKVKARMPALLLSLTLLCGFVLSGCAQPGNGSPAENGSGGTEIVQDPSGTVPTALSLCPIRNVPWRFTRPLNWRSFGERATALAAKTHRPPLLL